jgi:anti-sigma regulatory factor (Ser/Thr protein kinase)
VSGAYPVLGVGSFASFGASRSCASFGSYGPYGPYRPYGSTGSDGSAGSRRARGPWIRAFRGTPASVPEARRFVAELLAGCPAREVLMTCVSELSANAIVHSASGNGGVFIVEVACPQDGTARVSVTDEGSPSVPVARPLGAVDPAAEGGRGLALVAACTSRWGWAEAYPGRTVWAEACWPVGVPSPGQEKDARGSGPLRSAGSGDDWPPSPAA